jgi:hypothetical protein
MVANLRLRGRQPLEAAHLLGLALHHPASYTEVQCMADPALEALREALDPEELEAALARGAQLDLEQVVEGILAEG